MLCSSTAGGDVLSFWLNCIFLLLLFIFDVIVLWIRKCSYFRIYPKRNLTLCSHFYSATQLPFMGHHAVFFFLYFRFHLFLNMYSCVVTVMFDDEIHEKWRKFQLTKLLTCRIDLRLRRTFIFQENFQFRIHWNSNWVSLESEVYEFNFSTHLQMISICLNEISA